MTSNTMALTLARITLLVLSVFLAKLPATPLSNPMMASNPITGTVSTMND